MNITLRTVISVAVGLVVLFMIYITMPNYSIEPKGEVLPENGVMKPYDGEVHVYDPYQVPASVQKVGFITVEYHTHVNTEMNQAKVIEYAKKLAAQAGGDGIVFSLGVSSPSARSAMAMMLLQGEVLRTRSRG